MRWLGDPGAMRAADTEQERAAPAAEPAAAPIRPRTTEDALPWTGKATRTDIACWSGIMLCAVYSLALLPAVPALIGTKPVLLELLRGSTSSMVAAGAFASVGEASLPLAIVAAVVGIVKFEWIFWWAGRLWGRRIVEIFIGERPRTRRWVARVERLAGRYGWLAVIVAPFLPIPSTIIFALVGWTGMSLARFLICDALGALLWGGLSVALGYAIGQSAVDAAKAISHYALWISLGLVALIFIQQLWRARRTADAPA